MQTSGKSRDPLYNQFLYTLAITTLLLVTQPAGATGSVPYGIAFSGYLTNADSSPVSASLLDARFSLYVGAVSPANRVWCAEYASLTLTKGAFFVILGSSFAADSASSLNGNPTTCTSGGAIAISPSLVSAVTSSSNVQIGVEIRNTSGSFETLSPAYQMGSSAFALNADYLGGVSSSSYAKLNSSNQIQSSNGTAVIDTNGTWLTSLPAANVTGTLTASTIPSTLNATTFGGNVSLSSGNLSIGSSGNLTVSNLSTAGIVANTSSGVLTTHIPKVTTYEGGACTGGSGASGTATTGTYTVGTNATYLKVRMVGGGGGGYGAILTTGGGSKNGTNGGETSLLLAGNGYTCTGGYGAIAEHATITPQTCSATGTPPTNFTSIISISGARGGLGAYSTSTIVFPAGGNGGGSPFGGAGQGGTLYIQNDLNIDATGYGSGGAGTSVDPNNTGGWGGAGGNAGAYQELLITSPAASYAYSVGGCGAGGKTTNSNWNYSSAAAGNGGKGVMIIEEY